jgi:predicted transglutaminase-like cysteine proteinase
MVRIFISCFVLVFLSIDSNARWATLQDSSIRIIESNANITVNKDYTYESTIEFLDEILKEQGRQYYSKYTFQYDIKREKIDILEAYTIFENKKYIVGESEIENKPLASEANALAEYGQISIAFPKVVVGAKIYLKYRKKVINPSPPEYFDYFLSFGEGGYSENNNVTINSAIPLYSYVNDPNKVLEIKSENEKNQSTKKLIIKQKKPFTSDLVDEPSSGSINSKYLTWVAITSEDTWQGMHKKFIDKYLKVMNQKLPGDFEKIYDKTKQQNSEIEQINYITRSLNDQIQYLMDRRTISGNVFPRDLEEVAKTQYGDCKDFSFVTGAILKKLGYNVDIALVYRGEIYPEFKSPIPELAFNHMMLKVSGKSGNVYWLDPTNFQSMANGIFPDVADRMALVISEKEAKYEKIPEIDPIKANNSITKEYLINEDAVNVLFDANLSGQNSWQFNGLGKMYSKRRLEDTFFMIANGYKIVSPKDRISSEIPNLESRIVKDVKFKVEYKTDDLLFHTNLGKGLKLRYQFLEFVADTIEDNKIDFYIGTPREYSIKTIIKSRCIKNTKSLNFDIDTQWLKLNRTAKCINDDTIVIDNALFKKSFIKNEEITTDEFKKLKKAINDNYIGMAVIVD